MPPLAEIHQLRSATNSDTLSVRSLSHPSTIRSYIAAAWRQSHTPLHHGGDASCVVPAQRIASEGGCTPVSMAITGWTSHPVSRQLSPYRVFVVSTCHLSRW